jgi:hypothetical protein
MHLTPKFVRARRFGTGRCVKCGKPVVPRDEDRPDRKTRYNQFDTLVDAEGRATGSQHLICPGDPHAAPWEEK